MLDDDYGGVASPDDEPTMPNGAQGSGRRPGALRRDGWAPEISKDLLVVLMKHRTCREGWMCLSTQHISNGLLDAMDGTGRRMHQAGKDC